MGRNKKNKNEHRVKFGISIDPILFKLLSNELISKSKFIEILVKKHYEKKNL
jgi:Zn-dependent peptidase ImmA (M78 family)